jgi:hypothetical protein
LCFLFLDVNISGRGVEELINGGNGVKLPSGVLGTLYQAKLLVCGLWTVFLKRVYGYLGYPDIWNS